MSKDFRDFGLDYLTACHGIQSAIKFELGQQYPNGVPVGALSEVLKHHRTGIDTTKGELAGLAALLIKKRVFTWNEYSEYMRLAANEELARYEEEVRKKYGLPEGAVFR